jgi:hypothetical protein
MCNAEKTRAVRAAILLAVCWRASCAKRDRRDTACTRISSTWLQALPALRKRGVWESASSNSIKSRVSGRRNSQRSCACRKKWPKLSQRELFHAVMTEVCPNRVVRSNAHQSSNRRMRNVRRFLTVLFLIGILSAATRAIAAEGTSPPSVTSHEVNVLRQVAAALVAGNHAIQDLRGPPIEHSNLDRLKLPTPGMDCGIARTLMFVVCRSASLNKKDAEAMFARMIDVGQGGLPSDSWRQVEDVPGVGLIRSISYHHLKSGAKIDLDLVVYPSGEAEPSYGVRFFGWPRF